MHHLRANAEAQSGDILCCGRAWVVCGCDSGRTPMGTREMKKGTVIGLAAIAAVFSVGAANAADMAPVYKAPPPAPIFSWTGFYIGANVGFGSATASVDIGNVSFSRDMTGILGGGQIGYNWQAGAWV